LGTVDVGYFDVRAIEYADDSSAIYVGGAWDSKGIVSRIGSNGVLADSWVTGSWNSEVNALINNGDYTFIATSGVSIYISVVTNHDMSTASQYYFSDINPTTA
jgi:hypothetical protein